MFYQVILILYSIVVEKIIFPILRKIALLSPKMREQLQGREFSSQELIELAKHRSDKDLGAVFFCSSAGEFEQARPLIAKLSAKNWFVHVFFFSVSGVNFCKHRKETVSYSLSPVDSIFAWGKVFSALRPDLAIVVRHEFWPAFLETSSRWGKTILINFSVANSSALSLILKKNLMKFFYKIFVVAKEDQKVLRDHWHMPNTVLSGDTKYDRVLDRKQLAEDSPLLKKLRELFQNQKIFLCGSIYPADLPILIESIKTFDGRVFLIPHSLEASNIANIQRDLEKNGIESQSVSDFNEPPSKRVVVINALGILAELYAIGSAAYVGGAVHNKVHNVLEPMIWGLPVAIGPKYENSSEAILAVQAKVATVVKTSDEMRNWLNEVSRGHSRSAVLDFVHEYVGASKLILNESLQITSC